MKIGHVWLIGSIHDLVGFGEIRLRNSSNDKDQRPFGGGKDKVNRSGQVGQVHE